MQPPVNGTEQRLDAILEELRKIRTRLEDRATVVEFIDLKEPAKPKNKK